MGSEMCIRDSYTMVEPQMGGWGATAERPGTSAMYSTSHGDTFNCPVEIAEARYGFEVVEKSLNLAPQNEGGIAGGHGVRSVYQLLDSATVSVGLSHGVVPVWSNDDTFAGGTNSLRVRTASGENRQYCFASGLELQAGDRIEIETAYGGGSTMAFEEAN